MPPILPPLPANHTGVLPRVSFGVETTYSDLRRPREVRVSELRYAEGGRIPLRRPARDEVPVHLSDGFPSRGEMNRLLFDRHDRALLLAWSVAAGALLVAAGVVGWAVRRG